MEQPTLERAILLLSESLSINTFFSKVAIGLLAIEGVMLLIALYILWKVQEDTSYVRRKSESGD